MKQLNNYIHEKLHIGQYKKTSELLSKDPDVLVKYCQDQAKDKGLIVKFRNRKMNTGDFCFFIYDKQKQSRYLVGYDGDWDAKEGTPTNFMNCVNSTLKYIENYQK